VKSGCRAECIVGMIRDENAYARVTRLAMFFPLLIAGLQLLAWTTSQNFHVLPLSPGSSRSSSDQAPHEVDGFGSILGIPVGSDIIGEILIHRRPADDDFYGLRRPACDNAPMTLPISAGGGKQGGQRQDLRPLVDHFLTKTSAATLSPNRTTLNPTAAQHGRDHVLADIVQVALDRAIRILPAARLSFSARCGSRKSTAAFMAGRPPTPPV